jgi:hypothetical protein
MVAGTLMPVYTLQVTRNAIGIVVFPALILGSSGFWIHKDFQDRLVWLWTEIARHYKDNPWIAGYNPMNEPADPKGTGLVTFYDRVIDGIRSVDPNHMLFLDGNTYSIDFSAFPDDAKDRWPNTAYAIHDVSYAVPSSEPANTLLVQYAIYGFPSTPEPYTRTPEQIENMKKTYKRKRAWMDERGLCVWNGEWGPVYARKEYDGEDTDIINEQRYNVLKDQLDIYREVNTPLNLFDLTRLTAHVLQNQLSWSIWLYKDIGFQGMVYVSRETPYMRLLNKFLERKFRLAVDAWGTNDRYVKHIYRPIIDLIKENVAEEHRQLYPPIWNLENRVARLSRTMLVAEYMVKEWADAFKGLSEEQLDEIAASFKFENCLKRDGLNKILTDHAELYRK